MAGLTEEGFSPKTTEDIVDSLTEKFRQRLGMHLDISAKSDLGITLAIFASELADCWAAAEDVYSSGDPDQATGTALVALAALSGTVPAEPRNSVATLTLVGDASTVVSAGRIVSVQERTDTRFLTEASATLATATGWAPSTAYAAGDVRRNGGNVYVATTAGTSAGSGGPTTDEEAITDNTVVWRYLGEGDAYATVDALSEEYGPITAPAFTLTVIESPVSGLNAAINLEDAELGQAEESDAELRVRREDELQSTGNAAVEAIRGDVLRVQGVAAARVFYNFTDATDADGLPPHSVEVVVQFDADAPGTVEDDVREAIFASVGAGIQPYGTTTGTVEDDEGNEHDVDFTEATEVDVWTALTLEVTDEYPADGDAQVKEAVAAYWLNRRLLGFDVSGSALAAQAFLVSGVFSATGLVATSSPGTDPKVVIASREVADVDTARIAISKTVVTT